MSKISFFNVVHALIYIMNKPKIPVRKYHTKSLFSDQIPISGYINVPGTNTRHKLHFLQHYVIRKKIEFWKWIRKWWTVWWKALKILIIWCAFSLLNQPIWTDLFAISPWSTSLLEITDLRSSFILRYSGWINWKIIHLAKN